MKYVTILCCIMFSLSVYGYTQKTDNGISRIEISNDTVLYNGEPYCLLTKGMDGYYITTINVRQVIYVQPVVHNHNDYYKVSFTPLNRTYYAKKKDGFVLGLLHDMIKYEVIREGEFSAYGTNMLKDEKLSSGEYYEEWHLPEAKREQKVLDWNISWKETGVRDSTLIFANGRPFAYYKSSYSRKESSTGFRPSYTYVYYYYTIYDIRTDTLLAEVKVADEKYINVTVVVPGGEEFVIKDIPRAKDYLTIAAKLLLARAAFDRKE